MGYLDDIIIYSRSEKDIRTPRRNIHKTKKSRTKTQTREVLFFQETHTIFRTLNFGRRNPAPTRKTGKHCQNFSTKNPKEVKQFLGLVGYYRKFVPRFADISRVLTHLTKKDVEFKLTPECENCFQILKEFLQQAPIL